MSKQWSVQVHGEPDGEQWEISVIRDDCDSAQRAWGWFDEKKLLISHNGSHCRWPLAHGLGVVMVNVATQYAKYLNSGDYSQALHRFVGILMLTSTREEEAER